MYVTILENTINEEKELIDSTIYNIMDSRLNFILRTHDAYQQLIKFVDGTPEVKNALLKHRFYVEYKIMDVISHDR